MISGTTAPSCIADASSNNLRGTGYSREVVICIVVYLIPLIVLLTGLIMLMS